VESGDTIASMVAQSRHAATDVIRHASGAFGRGAFTTRQSAEILLTQLDIAEQALQGKKVADLSDVQRSFFIGTRNTVEDMRRTSRYSTNKAHMLSAQADSLIETLPGANEAPRVLDFSPRYLLASGRPTKVGVVIDGSWLGSGDPTLSIAGKSCERDGQSESRLSFTCALDPATGGSQLTWVTLRLAAFRGRSWWESLLGVFQEAPAPTRYEVGIAQIPAVLGHFAADARVAAEDTVVPVAIGDLAWGVERSVDLPDHVSYLTLHATLIDGVAYEDSSVAAPPRGWYAASIDLPHRKLVIRPRNLEAVLSNP
jgi:hypothetical protein